MDTSNGLAPTIYNRPPQPLEWATIIGIIALAVLLRLGMPGAVEFKQDEANLSLLSLDLVHGHNFPFLGIDSSVGIRNAPMNVYILSLPYIFSSDPLVATQYIGLLNVLGVVMAYALARRYYGPGGAIVAGLLYAVAPWSVLYSRKIWAQEMLPPFVVATVATGLIGFWEGKRWAQWLHAPLLVVTGQIHYVSFVLIPISLFLFGVGVLRRRIRRAFWLSLIIAGLLTAPYIIGLVRGAALSQGVLTRAFGGQSASTSGTTLSGEALRYAIITISGVEIHAFAGPDAFENYLSTVPNVYGLFYLLALAIGLSALWLALRALLRRDSRAVLDVVLLLWLCITPLAFTPTWTPVFTHYMIPIFPAAFIILGAALSDVWRMVKKGAARQIAIVIPGMALVAVAVLQAWVVLGLISFLDTYATPGGFGTPLSRYEPIRAALLAAKPAQVLGDLDGQYIGFNQEASVWNVLLYDVPLRRFMDLPAIDVYPISGALILSNKCDQASADAPKFPARPAIGNGTPESCYTYRTRAASDLDLSALTQVPTNTPHRFENGAQVVAYRWDTKTGCLTSVWATSGPATGPIHDFFSAAVHFLNDSGKQILNADGPFWQGRSWRAGDHIVYQSCLQSGQERIPEISRVQLGLYTYEDKAEGRQFYGVNVVDTSNVPTGQSVDLPLK